MTLIEKMAAAIRSKRNRGASSEDCAIAALSALAEGEPSKQMVDAAACLVAGHVSPEQLKANPTEARYARKLAKEAFRAMIEQAIKEAIAELTKERDNG